MRIRKRTLVVCLPIVFCNGLLLLLAVGVGVRPVRSGASTELWEYATGVKLESFTGHARSYYGGIYPPTDGWLVYYVQTHHERVLYRVDPDSAATDLPELIAKLESASGHEQLEPQIAEAYRNWISEYGSDSPNAVALIGEIYDANLRHVAASDSDGHERAVAREAYFRARWARAKRIWMNYAFESFFLTGWFLFLAWPWLRNATPRQWALHFGLAPLILIMPYYLGYPHRLILAGLTGAFIYPMVLETFFLFGLPIILALPATSLDVVILEALPRVLSPLSQIPRRAPLAGYLEVAPLKAIVFGMVIGGIAAYLAVQRRVRSILKAQENKAA